MPEMPADPFNEGTSGEQLLERGCLLVEHILAMPSQEEFANAIFALDEEDLRAVVMVLMAHCSPHVPAHLEVGQRMAGAELGHGERIRHDPGGLPRQEPGSDG